MGKSKDLATGETRFVNTAGDTMTGDLGIGVAPAQPLHVFKAGSQGGGMAPLIKVQNDTNNLTGDGSGIEFHGKYQGGEWGFGKIGGTNAGGNFGGSLEFHTNTGTGSVSTGFTKKMTIDRNGHVTMPYQPAFFAWNSTTSTGSGIVPFNNTTYNIGNHYSTSTGRFTAPVAGVYLFTVICTSGTSQNATYQFLGLNGNRHRDLFEGDAYVQNSERNASAHLKLSANDVVDFRNGGSFSVQGSGNGNYYSAFMGVLLG